MLTNENMSDRPNRVVVGRKTYDNAVGQPEISVEKTGTTITKLIIKCCCSEEITVHCHYATGENANE